MYPSGNEPVGSIWEKGRRTLTGLGGSGLLSDYSGGFGCVLVVFLFVSTSGTAVWQEAGSTYFL